MVRNRRHGIKHSALSILIHIRGKESSVHVASVMGIELHHPIVSTLWVHKDWSKRKRRSVVYITKGTNVCHIWSVCLSVPASVCVLTFPSPPLW